MCVLLLSSSYRGQSGFSSYEEMRKYIGELYQQQKYEEGIRILKAALDEYPDHLMANTYNLALLHMQLSQFEQGAQALLLGIERGIFYSKYAFDGELWAPLRESDAFKKFEERNEARRSEAQKNAKPERVVLEPKEFSSSIKYPLFIALHGGGGNIAEFKENWTSLRLTEKFITVYLQSSQVVAMDGFSWSEDIELTKKEIGAAYREVIQDYAVDTDNVLIGGFSSGGEAALEVVLNDTVPVRGFIVLCPPRPSGFSGENIKNAKIRGIRGALLTTEMDLRLPEQQKMAETLKAADLPLQFVVSPDIGHWFPDDMDKKIDAAIEFILGKEK